MSYDVKTLRVTRWPDRVIVEKMAGRGKVDECREYVDKTDAPSDTSDGYHTFEALYSHRAALTAALFNLANVVCDSSEDGISVWKAKEHADGTMFGDEDGERDMFIVGMSTPEGQVTYHYHLEWWDAFDVPELERAPEWDGHTPDDVVDRLLALF